MKNKTNLNKMKRFYFKMPNRIFDADLSATAIALYAYLAKMPEDFNPSISVIARTLKISKNTVLKYLDELKKKNIIRVIRQGYENVITKYEFNKLDDWT